MLREGQLLARRYRVEARIGKGAMGSVYRAHDELEDRPVALKRHHPRGDANPTATLLEREYHTLCQLAHPSIVEVYDYVVDASGAFYTMELLDGADLRERTPLPWRECCQLLRDVASCLAMLHSRRMLHRDLSARNVRYTSSGQAKLIDFGALMPMGIARRAIGTPPFVPPEVLQLQALDGRTDLYGLGALAYRALTGQHAYPARELDGLRDLWRAVPPPPSRLAPEVPEALDALVLELIDLDRMARPATAAEVMERLTGIAGLCPDERLEVTHSYLVMPPLCGRDEPLSRVRRALALPNGGGATQVHALGAPGSGRSRFLDACVLEAKLAGTQVIRGDASDSAGRELGLALALTEQLLQLAPDAARRAAAPHRADLAGSLTGLDPEGTPRPPPPGPGTAGHQRLQAALHALWLELSAERRLVIAVDDVDAVDEPSVAWLAGLTRESGRRGPTLLLTSTDGEAGETLTLLREAANVRVELGTLNAAQTQMVVRAVFGDVEHVEAVASRIHALCSGNPRWTMTLCEHLVESGRARYGAGSWTLPAGLSATDLPTSLADAFATRIAALPPDAAELCQALALAEPATVATDRYASLTDHGDRARTFRALDDLVSAGVLAPAGPHHRFAQRELRGLVAEGLAAERHRELHGRLAAVVEDADDPVLWPHHLLLAGREREAIERLLQLRGDPRVSDSAWVLGVVQRAVDAAVRLELSARTRANLRAWILDAASTLGEHEIFFDNALALLERLVHDTGLVHYRALSDSMEPAARLQEALALAQRTHEQDVEGHGGLPPVTAIPLLGRVCGTFAGMAHVMQDVALVERLPSLSPLVPLSPTLAIVQELVEASIDFQAGRYDVAGARGQAILERIGAPDRAGLNPRPHKTILLAQCFQQGLLAAARGQPDAPRWVRALENEPGHRVNAWRVRMTHHLMQGDVDAATACRRRAELLQLQDAGAVPFPGTTLRIELLAYVYADDVLGTKRTLERIVQAARRWPSWDITLEIARAQYRRMRGDLTGALEVIERVMSRVRPGRHLDWSFAAGTHLHVLVAAGRHADAVRLGEGYLATCRRERLSPYLAVSNVMVHALLGAGELERARDLADRLLAQVRGQGSRGLVLGLAYEGRALVASAEEDGQGFVRHARAARDELTRGENPVLLARYQRLLRAGERWTGPSLENGRLDDVVTRDEPTVTTGVRRLRSRLAACAGPAERAREALDALLTETGAITGVLIGLRDGKLALLASHADEAPDAQLLGTLERHLRAQLEAREAVTAEETADEPHASPRAAHDGQGRAFEPMLLFSRRGGETAIAALAALHHAPAQGIARRIPRRAALEAVADALIDHADVDAATRVA